MVKENKESLMRWLNSCNTDIPQSETLLERVGFFYARILPQRMRRSRDYERPQYVLQAIQIWPQACAQILKKKK